MGVSLILLGFVVIIILTSYILFNFFIMKHNLSGKMILRNSKIIRANKLDSMSSNIEKISIKSFDRLELFGRFISNNSKVTVILVHGLCLSSEYRTPDARFYLESGYNVLLIDQRAHGLSEGKYSTVGFNEKEDLKTWVEWINLRVGSESKVILDGSSMGATTSLWYASIYQPNNLAFIIADCPFSSFAEETYYLSKRWFGIFGDLIYQLFKLWYQRIGSWQLHTSSLLDRMAYIQVPVLFIHGENDKFVPHRMSEELFEKCSSSKQLLIVERAKHEQSRIIEREKCENEIKIFCEKYL